MVEDHRFVYTRALVTEDEKAEPSTASHDAIFTIEHGHLLSKAKILSHSDVEVVQQVGNE